jgi:hypothetical protein
MFKRTTTAWLATLALLVLAPTVRAQTVAPSEFLQDPARRATLKVDILANPDANTMYEAGNLDGLAALYNVAASPAFTVWKSSVTITEVGDNLVATELAGLSSLNATRLQTIAIFSASGVNPSLADRRAFFDDVFSGAGGTLTRAKLLLLWKRTATRLETLFATGVGTVATPATLLVEGALRASDLVGL